MNDATNIGASALADGIRQNASTAVLSGIIMIIAGFIALLAPLMAGVSITIIVGTMLIVSGIGECVLAFKAGAFGRALLMLLIGVLMILAGGYLISQPVSALAAITLILVAWLVATGLIDIIVALQLRPTDGWGWAMFSGVVTLLLGIMLWRQFPLSGAWAIGVLFGIRLMASGWALVFLGRSAKFVAASQEIAG